MTSANVLILGSKTHCRWVDALFDSGLDPVVEETIQDAVDEVRHDRFAVIVVDRPHAAEDVLEFVLNVRDIDEETPILAVGRGRTVIDEGILRRQRGVEVLERITPRALAETVRAIAEQDQNGLE